MSQKDWWIGTVGYEIYPRSFADSTGDGTGDLNGIRSKLDHLVWLGVDSLWITPFYPSPGRDHGYDVADYKDVNPVHGTLGDFDALVEEAHSLGLKVMVDIVPNHTSSDHPWFVESRKSKDNPYRNHYIWRDPAPDGGPPNNWVAHFGGPAWTFDETTGQYWCHLFLPEQPDVNWANPVIRQEFNDIFKFWCKRGADGFRIDVAHSMTKDQRFPDNPQIRPLADDMGPMAVWHAFEHKYDVDQDENLDIFHAWKKVVEPYGACLLGEAFSPDPKRMARFTSDGALDLAFFLEPGDCKWEPERLIDIHRKMHDAEPKNVSWVLDNHDQPRSVSRFGGGEAGIRRSKAMTLFQFGLGGVPFLWQGQELGLDNADLDAAFREDPVWTRNHSEAEIGRDVTRHGMPWDDSHANGFTTGTPWLPAADRPVEQTVAHQRANPDSTLHWYKEALAFRKANDELRQAPLQWVNQPDPQIAIFTRGSLTVVTNLSASSLTTNISATEVLFESNPAAGQIKDGKLTVEAETSVVVRS